jgi:hypothetical protein
MPIDFLPSRDAELLTWSVNFNTKITATPTAYGLTAPQATTYDGLHDAYAAAYQIANNPDTRSPSNIVAKDTAREALIQNARLLARIVQAAPAVTPEQKSELGLTVRDVEPTPIPPPATAPTIEVVSVVGRTVRIKLKDITSEGRGKPAGVHGAALFSYVGTTAPTTADGWKFEGNTNRVTNDIEFPDTVPSGATVWFTAFWFNPRSESGPGAAAVSTNLQGGAAMAA